MAVYGRLMSGTPGLDDAECPFFLSGMKYVTDCRIDGMLYVVSDGRTVWPAVVLWAEEREKRRARGLSELRFAVGCIAEIYEVSAETLCEMDDWAGYDSICDRGPFLRRVAPLVGGGVGQDVWTYVGNHMNGDYGDYGESPSKTDWRDAVEYIKARGIPASVRRR